MAIIKGTSGADKLSGTSKDDQIYGYQGNDTLTGSTGNDLLDGGTGADTMRGGKGDDIYVVDSTGDVVSEYSGEGNDTVQSAISYTLGSEVENLTLTGTTAINGTGNSLANSLVGNGAANILDGGAGNDTLKGGAGNDSLIGDYGSDIYVFGIGDGKDVITERNAFGDIDTVRLAAGIDPGQVTLVHSGNDLILRLASGDELRVSGQYAGTGIEKIEFANGVVWGVQEIDRVPLQLTGTSGSDTLVGALGNDLIQGLAGNDTLIGDYGSDTYVFAAGDGKDVIFEAQDGNGDIDTVRLAAGIAPAQVKLVQAGPDLIVRLSSGDELHIANQYAGAGVEKIQFADGTVWGAQEFAKAGLELIGMDGNETLVGAQGDDLIQGLGGDDTLVGDYGSDTYVFGMGDGKDVVFERLDGNGDIDTVRLSAGIAPGQVSLVHAGADLVLRLASGDELRVAGQYAGAGIEKIEFADGTVWGAREIAAATQEIVGTAGDETLVGGVGNDVVQGLGGDDTLVGDYGSDTYLFAAGDGKDVVFESPDGNGDIDTLRLAAGVDPGQVSLVHAGADLVLRLSSGDEVRIAGQYAGAGIEKIEFADGTVWGAREIAAATQEIVGTAGADTLVGSLGNDLIQGLAGDDTLVGDYGSDTYVFAAGDGRDLVFERIDGNGDIDTLRLAADTTPSQVRLIQDGPDLVVRLSTGDELRIAGQFAGAGIETIEFADGTVWGAQEIARAGLELIGSAGSDTLVGAVGDDFIQGLAGDDTLAGDYGSDTYLFAAGDGKDIVFEGLAGNGDIDTVRLAAGVDPSQVRLIHDGYDLVLRLASGDELRIAGQYAGAGIERIEFADGTVWGGEEIANASLDLVGSAGADILVGAMGDDLIQGLAGDDTLVGDYGSDTYVFAAGDGKDLVFEAMDGNGDIDTVRLAAGIAPSQVKLIQDGSDLVVRLATGDELRIAGQYAGAGIEKMEFADGTTWGTQEFAKAGLELIGMDGDEILVGAMGDDLIQGLGGNDTLVGDYGSDTYVFGIGDGKDFIYETQYDADIDTVRLGAGIAPGQVALVHSGTDLVVRLASGDELRVANQYAGGGIEKIEFADGTVWGAQEIGNATLEIVGTTAADTLIGSPGNDLIQGLAGDDTLVGDYGSDTYLFAAGDGRDVIFERPDDNGDIDTVRLDAGIDPSQVTLIRYGSDLILHLATGEELRIAGQYAGTGIEKVEFADGTVWDADEFANTTTEIVGSPYDDTLYGTFGNDLIQGRAGDDTLIGDYGSDTYLFAAGDGQDVIFETQYNADVDTVRLAAGIAPSQVSLLHAGADLVLRLASGDELRIAGQYSGYGAANGAGIEKIEFADGTVWGANEIANATWEMLGTPGNDYIGGTYGDDIIQGLAGNDYLSGGYGNDTLVGGDGADTLNGGQGADRFVFTSATGGSDTVQDFYSSTIYAPEGDKLVFSQSQLEIGDGDTVVDNPVSIYRHDDFSSKSELVIVTTDIAAPINAYTAADNLGEAFTPYVPGDTRIFVVDNGKDTGVFLFTSNNYDPIVDASELTQIATLTGVPSTVAGDYVFSA